MRRALNTATSALLKFLFSIVLLALAFWPVHGLAFQMYATFGDYPRSWVIGTAVWLALLALNLPLSLNAFRKATTISIIAVFAVGIWTLVMAGKFAVAE